MTNFLIIISAFTFMCLSSAQSKTILDHIELKWTPTTELSAFEKLDYQHLLKIQLKIEAFADARSAQDPELIGENIEDSPKNLPVKTKSDIGKFYADGMMDVLRKLGFEISETAPEYILSGKITQLFVKEKDTYQGTLIMKLFLKKGTKTVWEGVVNIENNRFGRSYKLDNYLEVYSDMGIQALIKLLETDQFVNSFGIKAPPKRVQITSTKDSPPNNLELKWMPTTDLKTFNEIDYKSIMNSKIKIDKFTDARNPITSLIGENVENPKKIRQVNTNSDIGLFYKNGFTDVLKKLGFEITDLKPDYILSGKLTHLFVQEKNTYEGSLILKLQLKKGNSVIWEDVINVEKKRFGKSFKMENYLEVYSDLGIEALKSTLESNNFKKSFQTKTDKN
jgi:hypothetical protein